MSHVLSLLRPKPVAAEPILDADALGEVIRDALAQFNEAEEEFAACLQEAGFDYSPRTAQVTVMSDHGGAAESSRDDPYRRLRDRRW